MSMNCLEKREARVFRAEGCHQNQDLFKPREASREHNLNLEWQFYDTGCCIQGNRANRVCDIITEKNFWSSLVR